MNLRTRRTVFLTLAALGLTGVATACGAGGEGGTRFLSLGTAGTGGIYYPLGGAVASRLSLKAPGRQVTAEVTGGSVENINRLRSGEMDLAFALPVTIWAAYNGEAPYTEPVRDLRILAPLYDNVSHVLAVPDPAIRSIADFRGRRVSVGPPGSGTEQIARDLLAVHGLTYDDVEVRYLSFAESAAALKDRAIEGALISVGYPASSVLDATTTGGVKLLPVAAEMVARLNAEHPYYSVGRIPANAYPGVTQEVPTLALTNWVVGMESLDAGVVNDLIAVFTEEKADLVSVHKTAEQIDMAALANAPIPLHSAVEAWRQRGAAPSGG